MDCYKSVVLDKDMYRVADQGFSEVLESKDPTCSYADGALSNMDAYQRQLKRFDIRVGAANADRIEKFFRTAQTATLFPEYVLRAVKAGTDAVETLDEIVATKTNISGVDYRAIYCQEDGEPKAIGEGAEIPSVRIELKENLVELKKTGRMLLASYETISQQKIELFSIALKQIGSKIAEEQLKSAIEVLITGDGNLQPEVISVEEALNFEHLIDLWNSFDGYRMNTILISPSTAKMILSLEEVSDIKSGFQFGTTGKIDMLMGAKLIKSKFVPENMVIALDKRFALEMVCSGDIKVEHDRLINRQLERSAITSVYGFARICEGAVKILNFK